MSHKTIHYFLGGNTHKGFYSHFNYILSQQEARRIICLKGGPGTGKSSLMKTVGKYFSDKGYDVELHHCSSDLNSLDGLVIKGLNVALLDGTSPHMIDPITPGSIDEILNMGDCLIESNFKNTKFSILNTNKEIGECFKRAYRYFASAKALYDDWHYYNNKALDKENFNIFMDNLKNEILPQELGPIGKERHLFASAFTNEGFITFIDNIIEDIPNIYVLNGGPGTGKTRVLQYISDEAVKRGLYVEILHTPLIPEKIEHIIIPELNVAIVTSNEINQKDFNGKVYYMSDFLNKEFLEKNQKFIDESKEFFYSLMSKGLKCISAAKSFHDDLEAFYVPNMDFIKANEYTEKIINKILKYE